MSKREGKREGCVCPAPCDMCEYAGLDIVVPEDDFPDGSKDESGVEDPDDLDVVVPEDDGVEAPSGEGIYGFTGSGAVDPDNNI